MQMLTMLFIWPSISHCNIISDLAQKILSGKKGWWRRQGYQESSSGQDGWDRAEAPVTRVAFARFPGIPVVKNTQSLKAFLRKNMNKYSIYLNTRAIFHSLFLTTTHFFFVWDRRWNPIRKISTFHHNEGIIAAITRYLSILGRFAHRD